MALRAAADDPNECCFGLHSAMDCGCFGFECIASSNQKSSVDQRKDAAENKCAKT